MGDKSVPYSKLYQIDYLEEFDFRGEDYVTLFNNSNATVFQAPQWLHHLYGKLIPALGVEPLIVTIRDRNSDQLRLVLPLVRTKYAGLSCIEPADLGICDYNAVVACRELESCFFSDDRLQKQVIEGLRPVHLIFFRKMQNDSKLVSHVIGDVEIGDMESSAYDVKLWAPYEDWKNEIMSSSFRKTLRRNRKKLESFGTVEYSVLKDRDEILAALTLMREQRSTRYEDDLFQQDVFFDFYCTIAVEGAEQGFAQTSILQAGSDTVAVEFGLVHDNCYHFILGGIDTYKYGKLSPGIMAMDFVLEHRVTQGDTRADFTIGDEGYKAKYGATPTQLQHMSRAETILGSLALKAYTSGGPVKDMARKIASIGR